MLEFIHDTKNRTFIYKYFRRGKKFGLLFKDVDEDFTKELKETLKEDDGHYILPADFISSHKGTLPPNICPVSRGILDA